MSREYLSRRGTRYHRISPGSIYESMVQSLVEQNAESLFPDFECRLTDPYFETAAGNVQPDLVLIGRDEHVWGLVEVESEDHSARGHVQPQLAKLGYARAEGRARKQILEAFADLDLAHLEQSLSGRPSVFLVTHGSTPVTSDDLRALTVHSINVSIYRGNANDFILKASDDIERLRQIAGGARRSPSPMLRGVWQILGSPIDVLQDCGGSIVVDCDGHVATWGCSSTSDGYLLRMPTLLFDEIPGSTADAFIDPDDLILVLRTSETG
jgi:hypothetical protein